MARLTATLGALTVSSVVPNLFDREDDARRLYSLYLIRLQMRGDYDRVIDACGQIRKHAAATVGVKSALFTFDFEDESLCHAQRFDTAWERLRERERIVHGRTLELVAHSWTAGDAQILKYHYCPLLYFRRQYNLGCQLLETALGFKMQANESSYDLLHHVYKPDEEPVDKYQVSLRHFYDALGKDLTDWQHWESFVNGFHSRLFDLARIDRDDLHTDAALLYPFFTRLMAERDNRLFSGATMGESDLTDPPDKVAESQREIHGKFNAAMRSTQPRIDEILRKHFPDAE